MFAINLFLFMCFFAVFGVKSDVQYNITGSPVLSNYLDTLERVVLEPDQKLKDVPKIVLMKTIISLGDDVKKIKANFIADLPNLEELKLDKCPIEEIEPAAFKNVPALIDVRINCELREIKEGVFNNLQIKHLSLFRNKIKSVATKAFDDMPMLESINLSQNEIAHWDVNWFGNTPNLNDVDFDVNNIVELPDEAFRNIQGNYVSIRICYNKIQRLGNGLFGGKKNVNLLYLDGNEIDHFGEHVLDGVETMSTLKLTSNRLKCVSGNFSKIFVAKVTLLWFNPLSGDCKTNLTKWRLEQEAKCNLKQVYSGI